MFHLHVRFLDENTTFPDEKALISFLHWLSTKVLIIPTYILENLKGHLLPLCK